MPGSYSSSKRGFALYSEEPLDAQNSLLNLLRPGDIFLTMGAGDNWKLGKAIADTLREGRTSQTSEKIRINHEEHDGLCTSIRFRDMAFRAQ